MCANFDYRQRLKRIITDMNKSSQNNQNAIIKRHSYIYYCLMNVYYVPRTI